MPRQSSSRASAHDPMLSRGVFAILLFVFAIITGLSFANKAGTLGIVLNEWILSFLFGNMRYFVPVIVLIIAWYLMADLKYNYRPTHKFGALLFFLTTSSLIHLRFPAHEMWFQALEGNGGGVFGMLAWPLKTYLGDIASWVVLIGAISISLLFLFNTTLTHFILFHKKLMDKLGSVGTGMREGVDTLFVKDEKYQDEDEEEFEEALLDSAEEEEEEAPKKRFSSKQLSREEDEEIEEEEVEEDAEEDAPQKPKTHTIPAPDLTPEWQQNVVIRSIPSVDLLEVRKGKPTSGDIKLNEKIIQETFKEFNIDVTMEGVRVGPTVTQFMLRPARGVKLSRITGLASDLALALAAHPLRIEAPIPGQSLVGIEVPNNKTAMVSIRELIESPEFKSRPHNMMVGLGKDVGGKVWFADLPRMPHLLIAGSTGSGKTVCMNTVITSLLYQNTAETLRMIMVDPKRVELTLYNGIPHLLTPVITNPHQTVNALKWTIGEMDRRFETLSRAGNRDITTYNKSHPHQKLPHLVFIIDELADLMATAGNDVEAGIIRLAQMARAVGIHLIVATQRPSVDVITGLMKANIPGRIAFSVASITDSRTILDSPGAEKLLGKGDMLLQTAELSKPIRIQGAFISEEEVKRMTEYLKGDEEPQYDVSIIEKQSGGGGGAMFGGGADDQDPLFREAKTAILEAGKASASFLQRRLKVGYARAARLLDELEEAGVIGPGEGAKPREILITHDDLDEDSGSLNVWQPSKQETRNKDTRNIDDQTSEEELDMSDDVNAENIDESEQEEHDELSEDESFDEEAAEEDTDIFDDQDEQGDDENPRLRPKDSGVAEDSDDRDFWVKNISP